MAPQGHRSLKERTLSFQDMFSLTLNMGNIIIFQPKASTLPSLWEVQPTSSNFGKDMHFLDLKPGFLHKGNPQKMRKWLEENRYLLKVMIWAVCWP